MIFNLFTSLHYLISKMTDQKIKVKFASILFYVLYWLIRISIKLCDMCQPTINPSVRTTNFDPKNVDRESRRRTKHSVGVPLLINNVGRPCQELVAQAVQNGHIYITPSTEWESVGVGGFVWLAIYLVAVYSMHSKRVRRSFPLRQTEMHFLWDVFVVLLACWPLGSFITAHDLKWNNNFNKILLTRQPYVNVL